MEQEKLEAQRLLQAKVPDKFQTRKNIHSMLNAKSCLVNSMPKKQGRIKSCKTKSKPVLGTILISAA